MKKTGSKKCLSLKVSSGKQQKISNFFTSTNIQENGKHEKEKVLDGHPNGPSVRLPGEILCTYCLEKSPNSKVGVCNQCNVVGLEGNSQSQEKKESSLQKKIPLKESPRKKLECDYKIDVLSSPDIIPATPPIKSKQNKSVKLIKRKFCFENENLSKKKCLTSGIDLKNKFKSDKIECSSSKENVFVTSKNTNSESNKSRNPFCKPSIKKDSTGISSDHSRANLNKDEIVNDGNLAEPLTLLTSSRIDHTDSCNVRKLGPTVKKHNYQSDLSHLEIEAFSVFEQNDKSSNENSVDGENKSVVNQEPSITKLKEIINNESANSATGVNSNERGIFGSNTLIHDKKTNDSSSFSSVEPLKSIALEENQEIVVEGCSNNFEEDIENLFNDSILADDIFEEPPTLDSITRCKVLSVDRLEACGEVVLALTRCDATESRTATCVLRGSWANCSVSVGDIVSVTARPVDGQAGCWVVDNDGGLLVIHPDTLVSGTTVVGSLFCMRRSVLSDMYRGIDSDSPIMVIGSFLHQLLQEVLKKKVSTLEDIQTVLDEFSRSRYFVFNLYSSGMPLGKTMETLREFIPKIHGFVHKYLSFKSSKSGTKSWNEEGSWNGTITDIADIEENIWSPGLGLKGKIDVTVKTSARNYKEKVMPLELKTGRASFSAEHRGQVILYTMMMTELGENVDSGLLLYLREGVMKEVPVGSVERRDLMLLRNELVTQLKASHSVVVSSSLKIAAPALPAPIHHHSACSKCPYLTLCSAALRVSGEDEVSEKNPLRQLSETSTCHVQLHHIVYVFHWTGLLRLEHTEALLSSPSLHHIWTLPPADRVKRGTCVGELKLVDQVVEVVAGSYQHIFLCDRGVSGNFSEGDYLIVSSASRPAVAAGPLTQLSQSQLTLLLERDLSIHQVAGNVWYLDKYESQSGLAFNMTNLGCLLDNTEQAERLRKAVIDVGLPDFSPKLSSRVLKASVDLLSDLNDQQRKAIFRALAADHYILIKGMPGTGKTATIVALVQLAVRLGRSVLITSHTHSAVDNVLLRLQGKVDLLRLGSAHKLHPQLAQYGEAGRVFATPDDLHAFYSSKKVVGVTCLGSSHALLTKRQFDLCIVDEATQVLQPTVLRPLFSAHKFVLIGDPNQLPPLVRSSKAKELGLGESLFARLDRPAVTTELSLQYRMNQTITDLANCLTYGGKLRCGSAEVASATIALSSSALDGESAWIGKVLSHSLAEAVVAVDTGVSEAVACVNTQEAEVVLRILAALAKGMSDDKVGVIAPYRAQVEYLRQQAKSRNSLVEVNTVDQYQGRDKDVIVYSCTRSAKPTESDILGDKNRLTVAITRARHKLIIVGNVNLLRGYSVFNQLFNSLAPNCFIPIS